VPSLQRSWKDDLKRRAELLKQRYGDNTASARGEGDGCESQDEPVEELNCDENSSDFANPRAGKQHSGDTNSFSDHGADDSASAATNTASKKAPKAKRAQKTKEPSKAKASAPKKRDVVIRDIFADSDEDDSAAAGVDRQTKSTHGWGHTYVGLDTFDDLDAVFSSDATFAAVPHETPNLRDEFTLPGDADIRLDGCGDFSRAHHYPSAVGSSSTAFASVLSGGSACESHHVTEAGQFDVALGAQTGGTMEWPSFESGVDGINAGDVAGSDGLAVRELDTDSPLSYSTYARLPTEDADLTHHAAEAGEAVDLDKSYTDADGVYHTGFSQDLYGHSVDDEEDQVKGDITWPQREFNPENVANRLVDVIREDVLKEESCDLLQQRTLHSASLSARSFAPSVTFNRDSSVRMDTNNRRRFSSAVKATVKAEFASLQPDLGSDEAMSAVWERAAMHGTAMKQNLSVSSQCSSHVYAIQ